MFFNTGLEKCDYDKIVEIKTLLVWVYDLGKS